MQQVFPPVAGHEFRDDHREDVLGLSPAHPVDLIQDGLHDLAVGAADRSEGNTLAVAWPIGFELFKSLAVAPLRVGEIHGDGFDIGIIRDGPRVGEGVDHAVVDAGDQDQDSGPVRVDRVSAA